MPDFEPASPVLPAGAQYKQPPVNVQPVPPNALVAGQLYYISAVDPNNRVGGLHGMVGKYASHRFMLYIFDYKGVLTNQDILVDRNWRPLYAGDPPAVVRIRVKDDVVGDYSFYPISPADIDNYDDVDMQENGGRRRRRRTTRRKRSTRRRTSKYIRK